MDPSERGYIARCWVESYATSDWARYNTPREVWEARNPDTGKPKHRGGIEYKRGHNLLVDRLFDRAIVLVEPDDVGLVAGWVCLEPDAPEPILHYAYTRQRERGNGVIRRLLADYWDRPVTFTHRSRELVVSRLPKAWHFDAYRAFL